MKKYLVYTVREFLGLDNDYETLLTNQEEILTKLESLQEQQVELQEKTYLQTAYQHATLNNFIYLTVMIGIAWGGLTLYNSEWMNADTLNSIKDLGKLTKDLQSINNNSILEALKKLNENSVNLSKEEIKLLLEIKNMLMKKGIDENKSLDRPLNLQGSFTLGNPIDGIDN